VASQLFTIQVTPAAAATLPPEASGNSTLPDEGSVTGQETPGSEGGQATEGPGRGHRDHGGR
jgi:hypothetical protein